MLTDQIVVEFLDIKVLKVKFISMCSVRKQNAQKVNLNGCHQQGCGSGLILTGSVYGSNLSVQTGSGSNLSGQTGSGSMIFSRPDPNPGKK